MQHFISFFIKFKPSLLTKTDFLLNASTCIAMTVLGFNLKRASCIIRYRAAHIDEIIQSLKLFLIYL